MQLTNNKQVMKMGLRWMKIVAQGRGNGRSVGLPFGKNKYDFLADGFQDDQGRFLLERNGKVAKGLKTKCRNCGNQQWRVWYEESGG